MTTDTITREQLESNVARMHKAALRSLHITARGRIGNWDGIRPAMCKAISGNRTDSSRSLTVLELHAMRTIINEHQRDFVAACAAWYRSTELPPERVLPYDADGNLPFATARR